MRRVKKLALLFVAVVLFAGAGDDARFRDLGHRLMCVCSCNQVLLECNHVGCPNSERMRGELVSALDRGDSDDLTLQSFVQKYGPTVLLAPTVTGFNRVAWVMPFAVLILALGTVTFVVRGWRRRPVAAGVEHFSPASDLEMERFKQQARKETEL